jgi:iron(III) transport system ATP-binding protein
MEKEILRIENVSKSFAGQKVLDNISLTVYEGELFFVLGPSGCGKTTLLRIMAGFTLPDRGKIFLDGKNIIKLPSNKRNIGMVFQNYALWPHMNVGKNISFGLEIKNFSSDTIEKKVRDILEITRLTPFINKPPTQLSGGQQQRVALARALVIEPKILLLDEPLSNLDAKLREEMRTEIKRIQKATGITMIYVTHDQREAMALGERIAVINYGKIEQTGKPMELYYNPKNKFVASSLGDVNFIQGRTGQTPEEIKTAEGTFTVKNNTDATTGEEIVLAFRPESVSAGQGTNNLRGKTEEIEYQGEIIKITVLTENKNRLRLAFLSQNRKDFEKGRYISFSVSPENLFVIKE